MMTTLFVHSALAVALAVSAAPAEMPTETAEAATSASALPMEPVVRGPFQTQELCESDRATVTARTTSCQHSRRWDRGLKPGWYYQVVLMTANPASAGGKPATNATFRASAVTDTDGGFLPMLRGPFYTRAACEAERATRTLKTSPCFQYRPFLPIMDRLGWYYQVEGLQTFTSVAPSDPQSL